MNALERFFLSHPELMSFHFDARPWIYGVCAVGCLWLPWFLRNEKMNFEMVAPPTRAFRCFRLGWLAGIPVLAVEASTLARAIEPPSWMSGFQTFCFLLWLTLCVTGIAGMLRACFREAKEKQRASSSF